MIGRSLETVFPARNTVIGPPVLEAIDLTAQDAFEDVSFTLHAGEVLGLIGVGGSGHVELGKALFGAYPLDSGSVKIRGREVTPAPDVLIAQGVVFLPEDRKAEGIIQSLSIIRNLSLAMLPRLSNVLGGLSPRDETNRAQARVRQLQIKPPTH